MMTYGNNNKLLSTCIKLFSKLFVLNTNDFLSQRIHDFNCNCQKLSEFCVPVVHTLFGLLLKTYAFYFKMKRRS